MSSAGDGRASVTGWAVGAACLCPISFPRPRGGCAGDLTGLQSETRQALIASSGAVGVDDPRRSMSSPAGGGIGSHQAKW
jgi:hypothetical protein